ncbi:LacI family DNA-binding transcriptional regulator [Paenibacillus psychroresistens]|uniref:LacI family DNA-binding transcriptional regulator n=1 Tax=Paenibacillus psychroresistens TaxID=1778678 RepID=UPI0029CA4FC4|nr:LacI family DNA-binding transcriptional regulator [Paenibacillus psychroresistens]
MVAKLKDVAEYVGVSISTVSRVISNDNSRAVSPETRTKIWDAVAKLGYEPNKIARQLVKGKKAENQVTKKVGCIVATPQNKYNHPYFSFILDGIEKGLADQGYYLSFIHTGEEIKNPSFLQKVLYESEIDGLIFVEGIENETYEYIKKHIPFIVGVDFADDSVSQVSYDRLAAAKEAVFHLLQQGHHDIGYIGGVGLSQKIEKEKRFRGYKSALDEAGLELKQEWILNANWDVDKSYALMKELLQNPAISRPTAMFAASDMMAISAMRAVLESNLRIPEDIAFIGIDNIEFSQYTSPPLSSIHIPKFEIGYIAAKTIVDVIQNRYPIPVKIMVPFELKTRESSLKI